MNDQLRYGTGGTITFDPPQHGRPSSASVTVHTPSGAVHISTPPTVTIDAVNTTISGAASEDDTTLVVDSASNIQVGRYYDLIDSADGGVERVRVRSLSGTTLTLQEPLRADYASGSVFSGNRMSISVGSSDADPLDEGYEVRWTYAIDGTTYYANTMFDICRSAWPEVILRPHEFRQWTPGISGPHTEGSLTGLEFTDEIEVATERVRIDLLSRGLRPDLFRDFSGFKRPISMMVICMWAEAGNNIPAAYADLPDQWLDTRREAYEQALTQALNTVRSYDADDSGVVSDSERTHRLGVVRWKL